ncbi:methyltransferase domain-containing protein [Allopontixanthobacter sp.]|uniref:methyltransferase domain-containing protein n=1 Tax=Allopontixanthobacter sp. TaxID=2906452 RepID=UPI002AB9E40C|nr:methyltransferase domain-containing protein [Allopontixanthobacter sp.]MDZ4308779.1 methyltransferase domain-containing protein [Allopontixanthobacter sp.]
MLETRRIEDELMDDPALDPAIYTQVLHDLAKVNRVTMAHRPTLAFLERTVGGRKSFRLLDVGFGDGDMLRQIARWAEKRGIAAELVGVDLNANSVAAAREATPHGLPITYRAGDYADYAGEGFDCIVSSLVAHHMTRGQLLDFLHFMDREAAAGWLVNDLHRHWFAYMGWPLLARLMRWHRIVRHDGHLSIARSYRPQEWPELLEAAGVRGARVYRAFPSRLCVEALR